MGGLSSERELIGLFLAPPARFRGGRINTELRMGLWREIPTAAQSWAVTFLHELPHALLWTLGCSVQKAKTHRAHKPKAGPESPLGMWAAIFAHYCQVIYLFSAPEEGNERSLGAKHWYSQSGNAKLSCQPELNCIMRVSVTFAKLGEVRGKEGSLAVIPHRHTPISPSSLCASLRHRKKETKPSASSQTDHKISILWKKG